MDKLDVLITVAGRTSLGVRTETAERATSSAGKGICVEGQVSSFRLSCLVNAGPLTSGFTARGVSLTRAAGDRFQISVRNHSPDFSGSRQLFCAEREVQA